MLFRNRASCVNIQLLCWAHFCIVDSDIKSIWREFNLVSDPGVKPMHCIGVITPIPFMGLTPGSNPYTLGRRKSLIGTLIRTGAKCRETWVLLETRACQRQNLRKKSCPFSWWSGKIIFAERLQCMSPESFPQAPALWCFPSFGSCRVWSWECYVFRSSDWRRRKSARSMESCRNMTWADEWLDWPDLALVKLTN